MLTIGPMIQCTLPTFQKVHAHQIELRTHHALCELAKEASSELDARKL